MTAQQQLAELMSRYESHSSGKLGALEALKTSASANKFLRAHGEAMAELIEAASAVCASAPKTEPVDPESSNHDDTRDYASDWADWYTANTLRAALRKLTQDATS